MKKNLPPGGIPLSKEEFIRYLNSDKQYFSVFKAFPDATERKKAKTQVENFAAVMFDALMPALAAMAEDPEAISKISEALKTGEGIIRENDGAPIVSGSKG